MRDLVVRFFLKLQSFARIDMRYAVSGGFFLSLTQVASAIFSLIVTAAFANLVSPEVYGTYRYILATYALLAIAALPGLDTAVLQSISRGFDKSLISAIRLKIKWGLFGTAASITYATYNFYQGDDLLGTIFILVAIALPFMEGGNLYAAYFNGKKIFGTWSLIDILTQTLSALSLIVTMYFSRDLIVLMCAYFLPYIIARWIATWYVARRIDPNSTDDPELFRYGGSLTLFQIMSRLITSADQIVLFHLLGPASVAIYSLAIAVPTRMQGLFRITGTLAFPKFAGRSTLQIATALPRKMALFAVAVAGACGAYVFLSPILFTYIFPAYAPSLIYSQVAVFYVLSAITYPFSAFLFAHKKIAENYAIVIANFLVKAGCLAVFVPLYGIWGAVIGLLATSTVSIVIALVILVRERRKGA